MTHRLPTFHAADGVNRIRFAALLLLAAGVCATSGCGGKRTIPPEETGTPTTVPHELVLYREARDVFTGWMKNLGRGGNPGACFAIISDASRQKLAASGIRSSEDFRQWFQRNRDLNMNPFRYIFSRVDVLDVDTRDTNRAVITASFLVEVQQNRVESVGSFFLVRQHGAWRIPFGDGADWERAWWQQEGNFGSRIRDEGLSSFQSARLGIRLNFPVTWDATDNASFRVPGEGAARTGVELAYLNPASLQKEACIRIWTAQPGSAAAQDSSVAVDSLTVLGHEPATLADASKLTGEVWRLENPVTHAQIHIFASVSETATSYSAFASTMKQIIQSIKPSY